MFGGFDVVLHVADEECFLSLQAVFGEDVVDFLAFVPDSDVWEIEVFAKTGGAFLDGKMIRRNRAEQEGANGVSAAQFQECFGVGQGADGRLHFAKAAMKPFFQLVHRDPRGVSIVKMLEREAELGTKLVQRDFRATRLGQDIIGGFPNGGQVIHQSARPIEDDVANHAGMLVELAPGATASISSATLCPVWLLMEGQLSDDETLCWGAISV